MHVGTCRAVSRILFVSNNFCKKNNHICVGFCSILVILILKCGSIYPLLHVCVFLVDFEDGNCVFFSICFVVLWWIILEFSPCMCFWLLFELHATSCVTHNEPHTTSLVTQLHYCSHTQLVMYNYIVVMLHN